MAITDFRIDQSAIGRGLGALGQAYGMQRQKEEAELQRQQQAQERQRIVQQGMEAFKSGDPNKMLEYSLANPQYGEIINQQMGIQNEQQRQEKLDFTAKALTARPESVPAIFDEHIEQIKARGGDPSNTIKAKQEYLENPEEEIKELEAYYVTQDPKNAPSIIEYRQKAGLSAISKARPTTGKGSGTYTDPDVPSDVRSAMWYDEVATPEQRRIFDKNKGSSLPIEKQIENAVKLSEAKGNQEALNLEKKQGVQELSAISKKTPELNKESADLSRLERLSEEAFAGGGAKFKMATAKLLDNIGINVTGLSESEQFEALSNALVLDKSQQMSGALSEGDRQFLISTMPALSNTKKGRAEMIGYAKALNKRNKEYAKQARQFKKRNGYFSLPEFNEEFQAWADENPLFPEVRQSTPNEIMAPTVTPNADNLSDLSDEDLLMGLGL